MTTLAIALAKIAVLEARLDALEAGGGGASNGGSSSGGGVPRVEPLPDQMLENAWADQTIDKDPPKYKGRSQVGRRYSLAPLDWLESTAGFFEWKAHKGRNETPVRVQTSGKNAGKPWHEADTFRARLLRAWAKRAAQKAAAKPAPAPSAPAPNDPGGDDDFNFGANTKPDAPAEASADDDIGF